MKVGDSRLLQLQEITETKLNKPLIQRYKAYVNSSPTDSRGEELYCICRKPDDGELMVACDGCDEWFHFKCMNLDVKYEKLVSNFYCLFCDELFHKGITLWKRKCRLPKCFNPILMDLNTGELSKYCCPDHGKQFMQQQILMKLGKGPFTKEKFAKMLVQVNNYEQFIKLGDQLPMSDLENLPMNVKDQIKSLELKILDLKEVQQNLQYQIACLNNSKEKSKIFNEAISQLNQLENENENDKKKKKRKKTDICGYDYSKTQRIEPCQNLQDFDISDTTFNELYENCKQNDLNVLFDICIKDRSKCAKHSGWYEIKLNDLQNLITQNNETKLELETRVKNLIAMGWDYLENL